MGGFDCWTKKDVWTRDGNKYRVEISRHESYGEDDEKNRWCVYAWIYPGHWMFDRFSPEQKTWDSPYIEGGHSYPSYFRAHRNNDGEVTAYQKGWDYNHDGDYRFGGMTSKEDAWEVFSDASKIFKSLESQDIEESE